MRAWKIAISVSGARPWEGASRVHCDGKSLLQCLETGMEGSKWSLLCSVAAAKRFRSASQDVGIAKGLMKKREMGNGRRNINFVLDVLFI